MPTTHIFVVGFSKYRRVGTFYMKTNSNMVQIPVFYNEFEVSELLIRLGANPANMGYTYIIEAMKLISLNRNAFSDIINSIYKPIASKYHTSSTCVERCMRHEIGKMVKEASFKIVFNVDYKTVSNSKFLGLIYEYFRIQKKVIL